MVMPTTGDAVTDTSVLINLAHANRFDLLGGLPLRFVFLDEVDNELLEPSQRAAFAAAIRRGVLSRVALPALAGAPLFARFNERLGRGESACLAYAHFNGVALACDEKRAFRRQAASLKPEVPVFGTVDIYVAAIGMGLLSVAEADADKALLATRRFAMRFGSFADVI